MNIKINAYIFVFLNILFEIFNISIFTVVTIRKLMNIRTVDIINAVWSNECRHESVIHFSLAFILEIVIHFTKIWLFNCETVIWIICTIIFSLNLFHLIIVFKFLFVLKRGWPLIGLIICDNIIFLKKFRTLSTWSRILLFIDSSRKSLSFQVRIDWFTRLIILHSIINSLGLFRYIFMHFYFI